MDVCKKCSDNFFVNNKLCKLSNGKYHLSCVSLKDSWINVNINIIWLCDSCVDKMNAAMNYVNSEGTQNTLVLQEFITHLVREKDLLQKLVNKKEYTMNLQNEVIASLNDGSLKSNNPAGNVKNNFYKRAMSSPSALTLSHTKSLTTETGSATENREVNITKMNSRSATPNPDIPKPRAGNEPMRKNIFFCAWVLLIYFFFQFSGPTV
ncbi:hypothetical protein WA026_010337 [Henosepilachna vigintioctopunctata]|uniref:Zinc finger PHD-type domain-containing protein n=1 Tax=Henosepilachna vigintioctopunctata TaxID=420089 RepID=A0AAW1V4Q5_9CUCU